MEADFFLNFFKSYLSHAKLISLSFLTLPCLLPLEPSEAQTPSSAATTGERRCSPPLRSAVRRRVIDRNASSSSLRPHGKLHLQPPSQLCATSAVFLPSCAQSRPQQPESAGGDGGVGRVGTTPINLMIRWSRNLALFPRVERE